jgi:hypothetical protein
MPRSYQPIELNTFVGGLITEASPLTFPQNASLDEQNFVINKDGSRSRRLGMDFEDGYVKINTNITDPTNLKVNSFRWSNAGGLGSKTIIVIQLNGTLQFFNSDQSALSAGLIYTYLYTNLPVINRFSFASVDGKLVVTTGDKNVDIYSYDTVAGTISRTSKRLLVRDLFGIEAITPDGTNLRVGSNISIRPQTSGPKQAPLQHIYNLRNQTWGITKPTFSGSDYPFDTIQNFMNNVTPPFYPSNSDSVIPSLYANTSTTAGSKTIIRFDGENCGASQFGNTYAPIGFFIIDALDRGLSRKTELTNMSITYPYTSTAINSPAVIASIPVDSTPGGANCVCEFAGRVWYAGFSGEVVGGDSTSPKLSSYVLFSQLVHDTSTIINCYQAADPTNKDSPDLVDTDGGFIRIQGAYNISGMVNLGSALLVFADNGVWSVTGGNSYGFSATNYKTSKLTNSGCISPGSIVVVEGSALYWSKDGIYSIAQNQYGDYVATNLAAKTIQKFYNSIPPTIAKNSEGVYDSYEKKVKWVYYNGYGLPSPPMELVLDTILGAFYKNKITPNSSSSGFPIVLKGVQVDPYRYSYVDNNVLIVNPSTGSTQQVMVGVNNVIVSTRTQVSGTKEVTYLILTDLGVPPA